MRLIDGDELYHKVDEYNGGAVDKTVAKQLISQMPTIANIDYTKDDIYSFGFRDGGLYALDELKTKLAKALDVVFSGGDNVD